MFKLVDLLSILCFNHIKYFDEDTTTTKHIAHTPFQIDKNSGEEEAQNSLTYRFCNLTFTWLQAIDVKMSSTSDMICENQSKETYLIGLVLGLITLVLWIMLWRKKKRLQLEQIYLSEAIADTKKKASISTAGSSSSLQRKPSSKSLVAASLNRSNQKNAASINDDEDGHMSDSAISFITNLARPKGPRFRKRDKLYFYGKKMLRSVRFFKPFYYQESILILIIKPIILSLKILIFNLIEKRKLGHFDIFICLFFKGSSI